VLCDREGDPGDTSAKQVLGRTVSVKRVNRRRHLISQKRLKPHIPLSKRGQKRGKRNFYTPTADKSRSAGKSRVRRRAHTTSARQEGQRSSGKKANARGFQARRGGKKITKQSPGARGSYRRENGRPKRKNSGE